MEPTGSTYLRIQSSAAMTSNAANYRPGSAIWALFVDSGHPVEGLLGRLQNRRVEPESEELSEPRSADRRRASCVSNSIGHSKLAAYASIATPTMNMTGRLTTSINC